VPEFTATAFGLLRILPYSHAIEFVDSAFLSASVKKTIGACEDESIN